MKRRGFILFFFLFIFLKLNQTTMVESEYKCLYNLLSKILNVSKNFYKESKNRYALCQTEDKFNSKWAECSNGLVGFIYLGGNNKSTIFSNNDFNCFSSLHFINFLFGLPNNLVSLKSHSSDGSLIDMDVNANKTISFNFLYIYQLTIKRDFNIYFSNFVNIVDFEIETLESNYQINYINDLVKFKIFNHVSFSSNNIPSMNYIQTYMLNINLNSNFNMESFSNFSTYTKIGTIELTPSDPSMIFPFPFLPSIQSLTINYQIDKPSDFIDLSKFEILTTLKLTNVGVLFNIDGELPFINTQNIYNFINFIYILFSIREFSNGKINYLNYTNLPPNLRYLTMENDGMTGTIPTKYPDNFLTLFLMGNKLTGELDESWFDKIYDFDISDNYIDIYLPSCFKCHYLQPSISRPISGNRFKNFDPNNLEPCLSIELNLSYNNSTDELLLYGSDLGDSMSMKILDNPILVIVYGELCKEYRIFKLAWKIGEVPKAINLTFPFLPQGQRTFEISAYNEFLPQIDSIIRYSDYFIISGKYFAYNQSVTTVLISNHSCSIITSNFNEIQCYLSNSNQIINNEELITSIIQVMNVSSTFNFRVNQACNGNNCPIADCNKYGEYNYESGVCDCYSNEWRGYSCQLKSLNCLSNDCSGNGYCNNIIGKCECNTNRVFDDCSGILCNNGHGCFNGGNCNFQNGVCNCSSKWIESSGCATPKQSIDSQQLVQIKNDRNLTLFGWFGNINIFLTVLIDGKICDIISNNNETIQCIPPYYSCDSIKTSSLKLSVSQNNYIWDGIYNPIFINGCSNSNEGSSNSISCSNSNEGSISNSINCSNSGSNENKKEKENSSSSSSKKLIIISFGFFKNNYLNYIKIKINSNEYDDDDDDQPDNFSKNNINLVNLQSK
ncbi:hypothetical protein DDB_G0286211 [Dictyostelium discoideum AX4]|uniref:EGF-like domain-containing protein n=1 Tax=Dictyostelium discoideum TaxID=44689 RepID=Q54M46_DICDI|nr:hypothetical protein DDB_G0286211 [Dictyostelium discoideum AX4]EAL64281.1 hypothetical protein DDB_G0286211 [Dictyostelium discoideum AX4]|eukprot:XP_637785.1 hypothetical protein DDB_G0286211 [Dictyostelium discoideum AX4]